MSHGVIPMKDGAGLGTGFAAMEIAERAAERDNATGDDIAA
jgi:hypothetical protein